MLNLERVQDGGAMRFIRIKLFVLLVCALFSVAAPSFGQSMADTYRMAAQAYNNAATQCQNPAGAMCMRQNAQYQLCLANQLAGGGSCGNPPACSTACTGAGGSGSGGSGPLFTPSMSTNPKADAIGNLVGLGISLLMKDRSKEETPSAENNVDPAALAAEMAAAERQRRQAEASDILQQSNSLFESINGSSSQPATPSSTVNLDALLDNGQPSDASTSAISSLLGAPDQADTKTSDPTSAVAGLLSQDSASGSDPSQPVPNDTNGGTAQLPSSVPSESPTPQQDTSAAVTNPADPAAQTQVSGTVNDKGGQMSETSTVATSPNADPGKDLSNAAGDFYNAVSDSARQDGIPLFMSAVGSLSPSVQAFNEEVQTGNSWKEKFDNFTSGVQYARDAYNGTTTAEQNDGVLRALGSKRFENNLVVQYQFEKSFDTATNVHAQDAHLIGTINDAMTASDSTEASYDLNTDINKIPYAFSSSIPGFEKMQRLAKVLSAGQNLLQVSSTRFHQWLYGED
jgi:hypothetical protein